MWHDWLTKLNREKFKLFLIDQISSRLFNPKGSRVLPLEIRNASLALQISSLFEVMSSRGTSSMLSIEWAGRVKWSETAVGWSMCCFAMAFLMAHLCLSSPCLQRRNISWWRICAHQICRCDDVLSCLYVELYICYTVSYKQDWKNSRWCNVVCVFVCCLRKDVLPSARPCWREWIVWCGMGGGMI